MKTILAALLFSCISAFAWDGVLSWEINTNGVSGYHVYVGTNAGAYYVTYTVVGGPNTNLTIPNLTPGKTYYLGVSSTTSAGLESDITTNLVTLIPVPPVNLKLRSTTQVSLNAGGPWLDLTNVDVAVAAADTNKFYRSRLDWIKSATIAANQPPLPLRIR